MSYITKRSFYKSLVLFLLNEVPENTEESVLELYDRWRKHSRLVIKDPKLAAWTLEYFARTKNFDRTALRDAAVIEGFVPMQIHKK